ncbi:MAG: hypothetical protein R3E68_00130 [Burkholderiaceae bacterium]
MPNLLEENRRIHRLLTEGADVEYYAEDGTLTAGKVRLMDFRAARQQRLACGATVHCGGGQQRRPDGSVRQRAATGGDRTQSPRRRE